MLRGAFHVLTGKSNFLRDKYSFFIVIVYKGSTPTPRGVYFQAYTQFSDILSRPGWHSDSLVDKKFSISSFQSSQERDFYVKRKF